MKSAVPTSDARLHHGNILPSPSWGPASYSSPRRGYSQNLEKNKIAPGGQSSGAEERGGMPAGRMAVTVLAVALHRTPCAGKVSPR